MNTRAGKKIIGTYKCPYEGKLSLDKHMIWICPFGHALECYPYVRPSPTPLKRIPAFICSDSLAGRCSRSLTTIEARVVRCSAGFHLTRADDLVQHKKFYSSILRALKLTPEPDPGRQCSICKGSLIESDKSVALLESCPHVFHAECLLEWLKVCPNKNCPECRQSSTNVIVWPTLIECEEKKKELFGLQRECVAYTRALYRDRIDPLAIDSLERRLTNMETMAQNFHNMLNNIRVSQDFPEQSINSLPSTSSSSSSSSGVPSQLNEAQESSNSSYPD